MDNNDTEADNEYINDDNDVEFEDDIEDDDDSEIANSCMDNSKTNYIYTLGMDNEADEDVMIKDLTINDDGKMTCNEV